MAALIVHDWCGYPFDPMVRVVSRHLALAGVPNLSISLRRRGLEGQLNANPNDDLYDLKLGVDYLAHQGASQVALIGLGVGALSVARYISETRDTRVAAAALIHPLPDLPEWLSQALGPEYERQLQLASSAIKQVTGATHVMEMTAMGLGPRTLIHQSVASWLSWWGPRARTRISRYMPDLDLPVLILGRDGHEVAGSLIKHLPAGRGQVASASNPLSVAEVIVNWVRHGCEPRVLYSTLEEHTIEIADTELWASLQRPVGDTDTVVIIVPGYAQTPVITWSLRLSPLFCGEGLAVLDTSLRRSGGEGALDADATVDVIDLAAWVDFVVSEGFRNVVLAGISLGSQTVTRYFAGDPHPQAVAAIHLNPTADTVTWARAGIGEEAYARYSQQARAAIEAGRGRELMRIDFTQPPPARFAHYVHRWMHARGWLSTYGPNAVTQNIDHIGRNRIPILLVSGSEDIFNDEARLDELAAAATLSPSVGKLWYPGMGHWLDGFERRIAADVGAWLRSQGILPAREVTTRKRSTTVTTADEVVSRRKPSRLE